MTPYKDPEIRRNCWKLSQQKHRRLIAEKKLKEEASEQ